MVIMYFCSIFIASCKDDIYSFHNFFLQTFLNEIDLFDQPLWISAFYDLFWHLVYQTKSFKEELLSHTK